MTYYNQIKTLLQNIADKLKIKTGDTTIKGSDLPAKIEAYTTDGTAAAGDIISGKIAYSNNKRIIGTYVPLNTSDATATANDIVVNKTAYANGNKITGTVREVQANAQYYEEAIINDQTEGKTGRSISIGYNKTVGIRAQLQSSDYLVRQGAYATIYAPSSEFGNATAADVVKGKTFTSSAGLKTTGIYEPLDTSDATATAEDITKGKIAYVNGVRIVGTREEATTT